MQEEDNIRKIVDYKPMKLLGVGGWLYIVLIALFIGFGAYTYLTSPDREWNQDKDHIELQEPPMSR